MEVTVAGMGDERRDQPAFHDVALGLDDAFREARDGNADVGDNRLRARPEGLVGPEDMMASRPEATPLLGPRRPFEGGPALLPCDFPETLRLFGDAGLGAVKFGLLDVSNGIG